MIDLRVSEVLSLSAEEQLRVIELICENLMQTQASLPLSSAHIAALDEALDEYLANPDDVLTEEEALAQAWRD